MMRRAIVAVYLAGFLALLCAQSPFAQFPPGAFQSRGALDGGAGCGSWSPICQTTSDFWYDGSNAASMTCTGGCTNGNPVSQWNDLSGNTRHLTQATSAHQPTYHTGILNSKSCVTFAQGASPPTDSSEMQTGAFTVAQPFLIMTVFQTTAVTMQDFASLIDNIGHTAGPPRILMFAKVQSIGNEAIINANSTISTGIVVNSGTNILSYWWYGSFNGASSATRISTSTEQTGDAGTNSLGSGLQISSTTSGTSALEAQVCEIFSVPITEKANAIAYVQAKWGL